MIKDYLIVAYLTAIAAWTVTLTLTLIGLSAGVAFYMRRRGGSPRRSVHAGDHCCVAV